MEGMSDIRNEIEQRLGVFARPGEKSTFENDADIVMREARQMHNKWKPIAERDQNKPNAGTRGGVEGYASSAIHFLENHIRDLKKYSKRADKKEAETAKAGLKEVTAMLKFWEAMYDKVTASRPGAKAEMDKQSDYVEYANLREKTSKLMTRIARASGVEKSRLQNELQSADKRMNELRESLRASRPGAKSEMDKSAALGIVGNAIAGVPAGPQRDALQKALIDYYDNTQAANRMLKQGNTADANRFEVEAGRAAQIAVRVWDRMGKPAAELRGFTQNLERAAKFSRPGAKAAMGLEDACWKGYEAVGMKTKDGKDVPNCVPKATAAKPEIEETEQDKAGLKLMEKADKAVSDKIRTLIKEGKPQDQAVAIALDMKRRGEI